MGEVVAFIKEGDQWHFIDWCPNANYAHPVSYVLRRFKKRGAKWETVVIDNQWPPEEYIPTGSQPARKK